MRSKVYTTASALTGVPSWNTTPDLSLTVNCVPSAFGESSSASAMPITPSGPYSSNES